MPILKSLLAPAFFLGACLGAFGQSHWTYHHPYSIPDPLNGVTWTGTRLIAVGDRSLTVTSPDGVTWTRGRPVASTNDLRAVVWTGSLAVAVGRGGIILTSPDGIDWTSRTPPIVDDFHCLLWTGTRLLACGGKTILSSKDGLSWTAVNFSIPNTRFISLAYSGSLYVAVGGLGTLYTSPDGEVWTERDSPTTSDYTSVTWAESMFVAFDNSGRRIESKDGLVWTLASKAVAIWPRAALWNGKQFLCIGIFGRVQISPSASGPWTPIVLEHESDFRAVTWTGNQYVAVGSGAIATSPDGRAWTQRIAGAGTHLFGLYKGSKSWKAYWQKGDVVVSPDGMDWSFDNSSAMPRFRHVHRYPGGYIGLAEDLYTSPDGEAWTRRAAGEGKSLTSVATAGNLHVAVGDFGKVRLSEDHGATWTTVKTPFTENLRSVVATGNNFVVAGQDGQLGTSPDGKTWTRSQPPDSNVVLDNLVWTGSRVAAISPFSSLVYLSEDGITWNTRDTRARPQLSSLVWTGSQLVIVGRDGLVLTSPDGNLWTERPTGTSLDLFAVAVADGHVVAAGEAGVIVSAPLDPVSIRPLLQRKSGGRFLSLDGNILRITAPPGPSTPGAVHTFSGIRVQGSIPAKDGEWRIPLRGMSPGRYLFLGGGVGSGTAEAFVVPVRP